MSFTTVLYHQRELAIALDPENPARILPPVQPRHKRILDVGCGMGQTLLALRLPADVKAWGVDSDLEAINAGRPLMPANITLQWAVGEHLPFGNGSFDLVYSRVALPYMEIGQAFSEFSRVLKQGGDLWLSLIGFRQTLRRIRRASSARDLLTCGFVLANGALFHATGRQLTVCGKRETFQTARGILRALDQAGLRGRVEPSEHFTMTAIKPH